MESWTFQKHDKGHLAEKPMGTSCVHFYTRLWGCHASVLRPHPVQSSLAWAMAWAPSSSLMLLYRRSPLRLLRCCVRRATAWQALMEQPTF